MCIRDRPKTVILAPEEVREAIEEQVGAIVDAVLRCLGSAPPELSQDLDVYKRQM